MSLTLSPATFPKYNDFKYIGYNFSVIMLRYNQMTIAEVSHYKSFRYIEFMNNCRWYSMVKVMITVHRYSVQGIYKAHAFDKQMHRHATIIV